MNCNVEGAYMNLRYRILNIGDERYILDMGGSSLWRIIFSIWYWILPVNVYKVNDDELLEKIVSPYIEQKNIGWQVALGAFVPLGLGSLLYPIVEYFDVEINPLTSIIIIAIIFFLLGAFFFYSNILCGRKFRQHINLKQYPKEKLWIRPESKKYFFFVLYFYILCIGLTVLFLGGSIHMPNGFMFFVGTMVLFMAMALSFATINAGDTTVRFKEDSIKNTNSQ